MRRIGALLALLPMAALVVAGAAQATANRRYGPNEYVVISNGVAPDGRHAITAHGKGELGDEDFHLYLMGAAGPQGRARIGPLEEVSEILDTDAQAYDAAWTPDSRHVALHYRADRHLRVAMIYRIEARRAVLVSGPMPLDVVAGPELGDPEVFKATARDIEVTWISGDSFRLVDKGTVRTTRRDLTMNRLGAYGEPSRVPGNDDDRATFFFEYALVAECRLVAGNRYEIVSVKPDE